MKTPHVYTEAVKLVVGAAILAIAVSALLRKPGTGAGECNPIQGAAGYVLQLLQPVIAAGLRSVLAYLHESTELLQHSPHIVASLGPLRCLVAG